MQLRYFLTLCGIIAFLHSPCVAESPGDRLVASESSTKTIMCFGDSLTAGYSLDPEDAFPAVLEARLKEKGMKVRVINSGVSGETSAGGLSRVGWVLRGPIDFFILALGANDGLRGVNPDVTKKNLIAIIDKVQSTYPRTQVVIAGIDLPVNLGAEYRNHFRPIFSEIAQEKKLPLIPFLLEGVAGDDSLNLPDRLHPNVEGQKRVAANVEAILTPLLAQP